MEYTVKLFIDDERFPPRTEGKKSTPHVLSVEDDLFEIDDWIVARSSTSAISLMKVCGVPLYISFDHDLGDHDTAMNVVNWLIDQDIECPIIPEGFEFFVHSENPVGKANIESKLSQYLRWVDR